MSTKTEDRCKVCGKLVQGDKAHVAITHVDGRVAGAKGPRLKQQWGVVHKACFARWTDDPRALLDALSERERELPGLQG